MVDMAIGLPSQFARLHVGPVPSTNIDAVRAPSPSMEGMIAHNWVHLSNQMLVTPTLVQVRSSFIT